MRGQDWRLNIPMLKSYFKNECKILRVCAVATCQGVRGAQPQKYIMSVLAGNMLPILHMVDELRVAGRASSAITSPIIGLFHADYATDIGR
jgi:hypothetical protein